MVMRVIGVGIDGKTSCRAMFKPLINRQDDKLAGAAKLSLHQNTRQIGLHAGTVGTVIVEDGFYLAGDLHRGYLAFFMVPDY